MVVKQFFVMSIAASRIAVRQSATPSAGRSELARLVRVAKLEAKEAIVKAAADDDGDLRKRAPVEADHDGGLFEQMLREAGQERVEALATVAGIAPDWAESYVSHTAGLLVAGGVLTRPSSMSRTLN
jgi:hypothetical protein